MTIYHLQHNVTCLNIIEILTVSISGISKLGTIMQKGNSYHICYCKKKYGPVFHNCKSPDRSLCCGTTLTTGRENTAMASQIYVQLNISGDVRLNLNHGWANMSSTFRFSDGIIEKCYPYFISTNVTTEQVNAMYSLSWFMHWSDPPPGTTHFSISLSTLSTCSSTYKHPTSISYSFH